MDPNFTTIQLTIRFSLSEEFKKIAQNAGYSIKGGHPSGKKCLSDLRNSLFEQSMKEYIEGNKKTGK